jgi:excisionase family DNA binding protein
MPKRFLTVEDVAETLNLTKRTVYALLQSGDSRRSRSVAAARGALRR